VFDCAGTTPSVSFSEEIEVEVEQEVLGFSNQNGDHDSQKGMVY
jgi:hypothetical protein